MKIYKLKHDIVSKTFVYSSTFQDTNIPNLYNSPKFEMKM